MFVSNRNNITAEINTLAAKDIYRRPSQWILDTRVTSIVIPHGQSQ